MKLIEMAGRKAIEAGGWIIRKHGKGFWRSFNG